MKYWLSILLIIVITGCTELSQPEQSENGNQVNQTKGDARLNQLSFDLEDYGPAPELTNEVWLNVDQPLRLADLHGQVVLLEMWTFG